MALDVKQSVRSNDLRRRENDVRQDLGEVLMDLV